MLLSLRKMILMNLPEHLNINQHNKVCIKAIAYITIDTSFALSDSLWFLADVLFLNSLTSMNTFTWFLSWYLSARLMTWFCIVICFSIWACESVLKSFGNRYWIKAISCLYYIYAPFETSCFRCKIPDMYLMLLRL